MHSISLSAEVDRLAEVTLSNNLDSESFGVGGISEADSVMVVESSAESPAMMPVFR